jgi:hypothetical protein
MKRIAFFLTSLLVLSFGLANAQGAAISLDHIEIGAYPGDPGKLDCNPGVVEWQFFYDNQTGSNATGTTNGFRVYSPDGANAEILPAPASDWNPAIDWKALYWDGGLFNNYFDGPTADTIGFGNFKIVGTGYPSGQGDIAFIIQSPVSCSDSGLTLCIDSSFYRPGGSWLWSTTGGPFTPTWDGPHCYMIDKVPDLPPQIDNCPGAINQSHCNNASFDFDATDPDATPGGVTYQLNSGPGSIDANTGVWSYSPSLADVGVALSIDVNACDAVSCGASCVVNLTFTNQAPALTGGCNQVVFVGKGNVVNHQMTANAVDCDPFTFSIANVSPAPVGTISIDPNTGLITFATDVNDGGINYTVTVCVSDGDAEDCCDVEFDVLQVEPFSICIEKTHMTFQGGHETVDITYEAGSEAIGGFDFLIAYDASALTFVGAVEGSVYGDCGWEYFTYRYGAEGNCSGGCPSGLLRVVGIAETNNGNNHPSCFHMSPGDTFAVLDFLVSDDRTLECQYIPIRFFWLDCGDNTISSQTGDSLFISRFVTDFDLIGDISNPNSGYPTYTGAQDADCFGGDPNKVPIRFIDFCNGGIDVACADSIDARGDINLNAVANEIADAVLFSNYFIYGIGVFTKNVEGQIAASDVNADGLTLSVADLVYLIRVIVGDALPYAKVSPVATSWSHDNGNLNVNADMGAAYVVVEGNVTPTLLADNMQMRYNYDGSNTRVIVYSMDAGATFSGDFLNVNGNVVSIEMATYEGAPVVAKQIPVAYALKQNYPNPFNPSTSISFDLAKATDYELTIYNVTGQVVAQFTGHGEAGPQTIEWDAKDNASGVYFYKLNAGEFKDTKKMVLLK